MTIQEAIAYLELIRVCDAPEVLEAINMAIKALEKQERKGKWIDDGFQEEWWGEQFTCSICNETMIGLSNYCPNCGADMRGDPE